MSALPKCAASGLACTQLTVEVAGRALVRDLELAIAGGTVTAILGRNGAGKTLTLHTLAGLRAPARGAVTLDGETARELAASRARAQARSAHADDRRSVSVDGARQRARRPPSAHRLLALGERRRSRDRARLRSQPSRSKISASATSTRCPAASAAASRSRRCSRRIPTCCCSTSRSIISTRIISSTC